MTRYNLDTTALLAELSISQWTARKLDKTTTDEVIKGKQAGNKGAARVNKHLLAGRSELDVINTHVGKTREFLYANTLPWSDSGIRLLPTANFMEFDGHMKKLEETFYILVEEFIKIYPTLITAQAMALGDMFDRSEFPDARDLVHRFKFTLSYMPVPTSGDFRVDVGDAAQKELKEKLSRLADERVAHAMDDIKAKMKDHLERMSDRLTSDIAGGELLPRKFRDSLLDSTYEICKMAKALNLTNDPKLDEAQRRLMAAVKDVSVKELRKDMPIRNDVKKSVDDILSKFSI